MPTEPAPPWRSQAGPREAGSRCPICASGVELGVPIVVCRDCGAVHHSSCWEGQGACGSYSCAPARREVASSTEARLVITDTELMTTAPLVASRPSFTPSYAASGPRVSQRRMSRLALASFVTAVAGIVMIGLVTGPVAVILACIALGGLQAKNQKGLGFALGGLLLGLADLIGWIALLVYAMGGQSAAVRLPMGDDTAVSSADVSPKIFRAMQANVLIERAGGWRGLATGSGVILQVADGAALIVTNRHIADPGFPGRDDSPDLDALNKGGLRVKLLNGPFRPARVTWVAPSGIDLALLRVQVSPKEAHAALWQPGRPMRVGEPVFAIGNPQRLGWTHTQGVISQFRTMPFGDHNVRVIQTQTAINPGNSGGGLYDDKSYLVGINTWTTDKRAGEGLSFAITFQSLLDLNPPGLDAPPPPSDDETKDEAP